WMVFSPSASRSMTARRERPIRREISWVRPPIFPLTDSRGERVLVERGSIAYSAVTQPEPEPCFQRGTPAVKEAAHSTRVRPNSISALPSAWSSQPRLMRTSRSWSGVRPSTRSPVGVWVEELTELLPGWMSGGVCCLVSRCRSRAARRSGHVEDIHRPDHRDRTGVHGARLGERDLRIRPGRDVGQGEPAHARAGRDLARPAAGEVDAAEMVVATLDVPGLAQEQIGAEG